MKFNLVANHKKYEKENEVCIRILGLIFKFCEFNLNSFLIKIKWLLYCWFNFGVVIYIKKNGSKFS